MIMPLSNAVVNCSIDRDTFEEFYAGPAPWDIDKPQKPFVAVANLVTSPVLDAGCGTGEHALFFAAHGHRVTGVDFVPEAIRRARRKAAERGLSVRFQVKDALTLGDWGEQFASVIDSGLFHVFSDDDRHRYVQGLARVVEPDGRLFLMCFSDEEPGEEGPRHLTPGVVRGLRRRLGGRIRPTGPGRTEPGVHRGQVLRGRPEDVVRRHPAEMTSYGAAPTKGEER